MPLELDAANGRLAILIYPNRILSPARRRWAAYGVGLAITEESPLSARWNLSIRGRRNMADRCKPVRREPWQGRRNDTARANEGDPPGGDAGAGFGETATPRPSKSKLGRTLSRMPHTGARQRTPGNRKGLTTFTWLYHLSSGRGRSLRTNGLDSLLSTELVRLRP
jgi:hypothetical protein